MSRGASPEEPRFILYGNDPDAPMLVALWARIRERVAGGPTDETRMAMDIAEEMERWRTREEDCW